MEGKLGRVPNSEYFTLYKGRPIKTRIKSILSVCSRQRICVFDEGTDYKIDKINGTITALKDGRIRNGETVTVTGT